jgi:ketosteroid isomerase-like protein/alpha-beta hydrolase superfamily lysophospholipase
MRQIRQLPHRCKFTRLSFVSKKNNLAGRLYLPQGVSAQRPTAGLVITGAWMTVKEQMPHRYAQEMARRGFVALTFDFRGWGESDGARRQLENPQEKVEDILAAAAFLRSRPEVAGGRIGGLGICASSGYMVTATAQTKQIDSVALVAPWLHDKKIVEATYGGAEGVAKLMQAGREAATNTKRTGQQTFVPAASLTDKNAIMFEVPYYTEADRGMIPAWRNEADPAFWEGWLSFDAMPPAKRLTQPFFMVHSEAAAIPQGARQFFKAVQSPKGELWLDNVTQLDFYDRAAPVKASSDAIAAHFRQTLLSDAQKAAVQKAALDGTREFFAALEAADIPRFLQVWAYDGVQEMPYSPGAFPKRLEGRAAIEKQYGPLPTAYTGMRFPMRRLVATQEPGVVVAEYDGSIGLKSGGRYDNRYIGVFAFNPQGQTRPLHRMLRSLSRSSTVFQARKKRPCRTTSAFVPP